MALFTEQLATRCQRGPSCPKKDMQNQGRIRYMRSQYPGAPGKMLCDPCWAYYEHKGVGSGVPIHGNFAPEPQAPAAHHGAYKPSQENIKKDIAAAQKGEAAHVKAVGSGIKNPSALAGMFPPPYAIAGSSKVPNVHVPGLDVFERMRATFENSTRNNANAKVSYGYQPIHDFYSEIKQALQKAARQGVSIESRELVVVKAVMVTFEEGKKKATIVGSVQESIGCVPVHIGASDLKALVFAALYPIFVKWGRTSQLSYEECSIRDKDGVIIEPVNGVEADHDALPQEQFFHFKEVQRKARRIFKATKPAEVSLEIPFPVYAKARSHKQLYKAGMIESEESEGGENDDDSSVHEQQTKRDKTRAIRVTKDRNVSQSASSQQGPDSEMIPPRGHHLPALSSTAGDDDSDDALLDKPPLKAFANMGRAKRRNPDNDDKDEEDDSQSTFSAAPSKRPKSSAVPDGLTAEAIKRVLRRQQGPSRPAVIALLASVDVPVTVRPKPYVSFAEMMRLGGPPKAAPVSAVVTYNPKGTPQFGTFKLAFFAQISPPLPGFPPSGSIVLKQSYVKTHAFADTEDAADGSSGHRVPAGTDGPTKKYTLVDSGQQVVNLEKDVLCMQWASALMDLVYKFIADSPHQNPPFAIPKMRYVQVALAMEQVQSTDRRVFMLEERIDKDVDGAWRKYINNGSAMPLTTATSTPERRNTTDFLVFCQHVQYQQTAGCAFVSDFQGGDLLLSDPQVLTQPELLAQFGDGNVEAAFLKFCDEHECSKFCKFYTLGRPGSSNSKGKGRATEDLFLPSVAAKSKDTEDDPASENGIKSMVMSEKTIY